MDSIIAAGGAPLMMPITTDMGILDEFVNMCDAFAIPGGQGVDPTRWGERAIGRWPCPERDALEFPMVEKVLDANKPLLCICRGMQLLNVAFGGSLAQNIDDLSCEAESLDILPIHRNTLQSLAHEVRIKEGTMLARITGQQVIEVNSHHGQAIRKVGEGLIVSGMSPQGTVEAIELPSKRFCMGVQWHPEYTWTFNDCDKKIWDAFIEAASVR